MNLQTLKNLSVSNKVSKSQLARLAGISSAAVTQWFRKGRETAWANIETNTLKHLSEGLGLSPEVFLKPPLPLGPLKTRFLWDALYPNMEEFVGALLQGRGKALARLLQILGFHEAQKVVGRKIVTRFQDYKKYLKPIRRKQLELLWPLYV